MIEKNTPQAPEKDGWKVGEIKENVKSWGARRSVSQEAGSVKLCQMLLRDYVN